jgi:hypothetical protein
MKYFKSMKKPKIIYKAPINSFILIYNKIFIFVIST